MVYFLMIDCGRILASVNSPVFIFLIQLFEITTFEGVPTVGNFHRVSDIGDIVPQKWV